MKALILIGGYGTRLRPLTLSIPKPLVEFANKPMLLHQIKALLEVDISEIVLAINRQAEPLEVIQNRNVKLIFSYEDEALDTGGPLAQAAPYLAGERFFVTKVEEPSKYGAVVHNDQTGLVKRFVEKPSEYIANKINAGLYIFEPSILKRIEAKPMSIETAVFPAMVRDGELYCMEFSGFWMDIGQPADYLAGLRLYLGHLYECKSPLLTVDPGLIGNVLVVSAGAIIEDGVRISNSAIFSKSIIKSHAWLNNCIVGWRSVVGKWVIAYVRSISIFFGVLVREYVFLVGFLHHGGVPCC
ncbi:unnamed protein product [Trichobilharzia regenti]|nr:unnamed protein product [Trichobilharzia regenti]